MKKKDEKRAPDIRKKTVKYEDSSDESVSESEDENDDEFDELMDLLKTIRLKVDVIENQLRKLMEK